MDSRVRQAKTSFEIVSINSSEFRTSSKFAGLGSSYNPLPAARISLLADGEVQVFSSEIDLDVYARFVGIADSQ